MMTILTEETIARAVLGLLAANLLARAAAALATRTFSPRLMADWLATRTLPYLLRAVSVEIALLALPPEWAETRRVVRSAVWLFACSALVGHTLAALREPPLTDSQPKG
jgi:hypothetical protein